MIFYEVWDQRSGNLLGSYGTEAEALDLVRDIVARSGRADDLGLASGDDEDDEQGGEIAEGADLVSRALGAGPVSA